MRGAPTGTRMRRGRTQYPARHTLVLALPQRRLPLGQKHPPGPAPTDRSSSDEGGRLRVDTILPVSRADRYRRWCGTAGGDPVVPEWRDSPPPQPAPANSSGHSADTPDYSDLLASMLDHTTAGHICNDGVTSSFSRPSGQVTSTALP